MLTLGSRSQGLSFRSKIFMVCQKSPITASGHHFIRIEAQITGFTQPPTGLVVVSAAKGLDPNL